MLEVAVLAASAAMLDRWKSWQCEGEPAGKAYVNYAVGFSVTLPKGLFFRRPVQAGPERGAQVPLAPDCAAVVVVFGEPNSIEWRSADAAIAWEVAWEREHDPGAVLHVYSSQMGSLMATGLHIEHATMEDVEDVVVALRPGGGIAYTARLATSRARYRVDLVRFLAVLRGFRLTEWR